ncbi:MAG TPA: DnaD domain protein [Lactobacillaceae bacterium]|jgi:replication initiation and membrane attachment protein
MADNRAQLNPQATVQIRVQAGVTGDSAVLAQLYLPFIGQTALALYQLLVLEARATTRDDHNFLLDSLNVNLTDFVAARQKLEAVGLLKTFATSDSVLTYVVVAPLSAPEFFKEPLLAGLLAKFIGELRFETLKERFLTMPEVAGENLSARFTDIFQVPNAPVTTAVQEATPLATASVDWDIVAELLHAQGLTRADLKKHEAFLAAQVMLYGLDETRLAMVIQQTLSLDKRQIDETAIRQQLSRVQTVTPVEQPKKPAVASANPLVQAAQSLTPMQFIQQLQQQRGGFVTNAERRVVSQLLERHALTPEVINILTHEILVGQGKTNVTLNLAEAIANNWRQQGIQTAQQAIDLIAKRNKAATSTPKKATRKPQKVEQQPDYSGANDFDTSRLSKILEDMQ